MHILFLAPRLPVPADSAMDIFVLSFLTEGVPPLTVLEAMACRVPVVATKVGGIPEMLKDGETGLLVGAQDTDALRTAIETLSGNVGKRQMLTNLAYEFVQANYSLERMCKANKQVYNEVLSYVI
ncbi:MAG: glycosyltransferase family 4 protein [Candidatus Omnitrophica bacterium]|nr:glycosyltransferase family 4 protein [Candidatus Omnitrophota bacterium]